MSGVVKCEVKEHVKMLGTLPVLPISLYSVWICFLSYWKQLPSGLNIHMERHFEKMEEEGDTIATISHGFSKKLDKTHH